MATTSGITATIIQFARVLDVNIASYTLTVATEFAPKPLSSISFAVPYLHPNNGEGIYFMPEVGSVCWVCVPSDGNMPFVIAWAPAANEGDFRSHRKDLNPGDICLATRDENFIILRRGGVLQIGSTGICQRIYMPVNNTIQDFCENYGLHTLGGDLEWSVAREEKTTDGKRPATLTLKAREFANDAAPIAELKIGSHDGDPKTILGLAIKASGEKGAETQISLKMDKEGSISWVVKKNYSMVLAEGDYSVETKTGGAKFKTKKAFEVESADAFKVKAEKNIDLASKASMFLEASSGIKLVSETKVGNALFGAVIMTPQLLTWLAGHTHPCTAPGSPSGPPVPVLDTGGCTSKKLKAE